MTAILLLVLAQPAASLNGEPLTAIKCDGGVVCARRGTVGYVYGTGAAGSSGYATVQDEGVALAARTAIDFTGAGVTCTDTGAKTSCSIPGGGAGGAPTSATYITQTPDGTLTNEQALSSLSTALMISTTGTGVVSSYAGSSCGANQYATNTSATGVLTCSQVTTAQLSGTISNAQLASTYSGVGACGANTWASTLNGNAAPTCTQPAFSNLSGSASTAQLPTVPVTKGGTNLITVAANQVLVGTAADTFTAKTLPSCSNATTSKLLFDNATQTWTCGTDQSGGGSGGASPLSLLLGSP